DAVEHGVVDGVEQVAGEAPGRGVDGRPDRADRVPDVAPRRPGDVDGDVSDVLGGVGDAGADVGHRVARGIHEVIEPTHALTLRVRCGGGGPCRPALRQHTVR